MPSQSKSKPRAGQAAFASMVPNFNNMTDHLFPVQPARGGLKQRITSQLGSAIRSPTYLRICLSTDAGHHHPARHRILLTREWVESRYGALGRVVIHNVQGSQACGKM